MYHHVQNGVYSINPISNDIIFISGPELSILIHLKIRRYHNLNWDISITPETMNSIQRCIHRGLVTGCVNDPSLSNFGFRILFECYSIAQLVLTQQETSSPVIPKYSNSLLTLLLNYYRWECGVEYETAQVLTSMSGSKRRRPRLEKRSRQHASSDLAWILIE